MRIGYIGRTELRLHPLLPAVLAAAWIFGKVSSFLQALLAVAVHELGHAVVGYAFSVRVYSLELLPFGAVARLDRQALNGDAELCIAAAGPLTSLLTAGLTAVFADMVPATAGRTESFLTYQLVLAAVNLLPALPLDGGHILRALLQRRLSLHGVTVFACGMGVLFGLGFLVLAVIGMRCEIYNLTVPTMGVFLLLTALREIRMLPEAEVQAHYRRMDALRSGGIYRMEFYAVPASMKAQDALRLLRRDRLHVLRVMDAQHRCLGELDETVLLERMAVMGAQRALCELLVFDRCKGV